MDIESPSTPAPPISPARLIARRATDLLAISVVLVFGLSAGQQIIAWWRTDATGPQLAAGAADPQIDWSGRPLELQFGESSLGMQRIPFTGTRDAAEQQLIRLARAALLAPKQAMPPIMDDEAAWITALEQLTPEESQPELGTIYLVPGFLPSVAAIRNVDLGVASKNPARLAAWGMATPTGENAWTLMMFRESSAQQPIAVGPELPSGAETLLAWQDQAGNRVVSFRCEGQLEAWLASFDRQFGSTTSVNRTVDDTRAAGRWHTSQGGIDVQLTRQGQEITGLLWITAPVPRHNADGENLKPRISNSRHVPNLKKAE